MFSWLAAKRDAAVAPRAKVSPVAGEGGAEGGKADGGCLSRRRYLPFFFFFFFFFLLLIGPRPPPPLFSSF